MYSVDTLSINNNMGACAGLESKIIERFFLSIWTAKYRGGKSLYI